LPEKLNPSSFDALAGMATGRVIFLLANNAMLGENMGRRYQSIVETIGNTPVVRINRLAPQGVGALKIAAEAEKGANILCMLPDAGERYLSAPLFADVSADMNEEELKISRSTQSAQLNT
jgi:hypothetical protein